ncbi:DUF305 domain-containing protein [Roseomonas sp. KE2513]|uniref:DUF305 domain-containing protein n=1 Tax=Roseomonas sp. KE2513 TaxID=2479202 RepID=UPI0018E01BFE|nr:DUF305 domain-containing protein [Roseomonas sp. KE2513]MBI0538591.1 DUF305 domain-containing protein [Roseomonas sp. KE2513]
MRKTPCSRLAVLAAAVLATTAPAWSMVGEGADEGIEPVIVSSYTVVPSRFLGAALKADRDYLDGMRPHHAGALTMSEEYLRDPSGSSPVLRTLAQAIIHNQRFEIALLDEVRRRLAQPPTIWDLGLATIAVQPAASDGLAISYRFTRFPIPGPLPVTGLVNERDVQFAKAMSIHHQGALDMAMAYQADPNARNTFLRLLNVDIITDQRQEIALMQRVIAAYPGNAEAVLVPASMVHGMEGMGHASHAMPGQAEQPAMGSHAALAVPMETKGGAASQRPSQAPQPGQRARARSQHNHHGN